jgi:hypothetical protein
VVKKSPAKKSSGKKKVTKATVVKAKRKPAVKTGAKKKTTKTAGAGTRKKTVKPAAKKVTRKTAAKPAAKKTVKKAAKKPSGRKAGVLKKVAKAFRKPSKKKKVVRSSSLHKVLAAHGVEQKAPAVRPPFPAYRGTMPYIFISYSHADMKEVFRIIKQLNSSRYRIWFDDTSADKNIIVIYLKSTPLSEGLLLQIGTVQYFNKFEMSDKEFIDKLKRVLNNDLHN